MALRSVIISFIWLIHWAFSHHSFEPFVPQFLQIKPITGESVFRWGFSIAMLDRVKMDIIQLGIVIFFVSNAPIPIVLPDLSPCLFFCLIKLN